MRRGLLVEFFYRRGRINQRYRLRRRPRPGAGSGAGDQSGRWGSRGKLPERYAARLTVTLAFDFQLVRAIVQNANLVAIESGSCLVGVTLGIENFPDLMKRERELPAAALIRLRSPIRLLRD